MNQKHLKGVIVMNKKDLINFVAGETGCTKKDAAIMVTATVAGIKSGIMNDGKVGLVGFGTFKAVARKARTARNPQTGEPVEVPARMVPVWKASKILKEEVITLSLPEAE